MSEGWHEDDYLVLFNPSLTSQLSVKYELSRFLAGYALLGLRGWDDFIVSGPDGKTYTVPTVPLLSKYLAAFNVPPAESLKADDRFIGKIKWYKQPVVFGGDPVAKENLMWVDHDQHAKAVVYWNDLYHEHASTKEG